MNNKAQTIGSFLMVFITVIVGIALMIAVASDYGRATTTGTINYTVTAPATNGVLNLVGQELLNTPVVQNASGGDVWNTANYTIAEGVSTTTGTKRIIFTTLVDGIQGASINVTYNYGPEGYIVSSGARSVASLILIFMAVAIAMVALEPTLRNNALGLIGMK